MKIFGFDFSRKANGDVLSIEELQSRLMFAMAPLAGVIVTPETCMESPTVHAIVTAVSRRISVSPVGVYRKTTSSKGRDSKEKLPNHPVARLLNRPNDWQSRVSYWLDATSWLVRHGNHYAYKARGQTGPVRRLLPLHPGCTDVKQQADWSLVYTSSQGGSYREYEQNEIHHVRGPARNGYKGDSPVDDVRQAIALEIAAERMGASFFGNGALPTIIFKAAAASAGFKTVEDQKKFLEDFQEKYSGRRRFSAFFLPKGVEQDKGVEVANDKAQFLETRKYQRTVIAGAFGVPPHLVGDLERATFNNVEQQDADFTINVVLPIAQCFEAAMERDLLTDDDRREGIVIRFNLDAIQRADFKSRQEGNRIMREGGALSPNEWRERENMNPIADDDGGDDYVRPANFVVAGAEPVAPPPIDPAALPQRQGAMP